MPIELIILISALVSIMTFMVSVEPVLRTEFQTASIISLAILITALLSYKKQEELTSDLKVFSKENIDFIIDDGKFINLNDTLNKDIEEGSLIRKTYTKGYWRGFIHYSPNESRYELIPQNN